MLAAIMVALEAFRAISIYTGAQHGAPLTLSSPQELLVLHLHIYAQPGDQKLIYATGTPFSSTACSLNTPPLHCLLLSCSYRNLVFLSPLPAHKQKVLMRDDADPGSAFRARA